MDWRSIAWVALGSAAGGVARFAVGAALAGRAPWGIALGTLSVNVAGSAAFGWLVGRRVETAWPDPLWHGVTVGVLGGLTTYSSFNTELLRHAIAGQWGRAAACAIAMIAACCAGGFAGWALGSRGG